MSYSYSIARQVEVWNAPKTISAVAYGILLAFTGAYPIGSVAGGILQVRGTAANDGFWTIDSIFNPTTLVMAEVMTAQGAGGQGVVLPIGLVKIVSGLINSLPDAETINSVAANFITNGCVVGDRVGIFGSTNDNGSYLVTEVVSENVIRVQDRYLNANPLAGGGTLGSLRLEGGYGRITVTDEATTDWASIAAGIPNLGITTEEVGPVLTLYRVPSTNYVRLQQTGATATKWTSHNEIVMPIRSSADNISSLITCSGASALSSTIEVGVSGTDIWSTTSGSFWFGGLLNPRTDDGAPFTVNMFGSVSQYGGLLYAESGSILRNNFIDHQGVFINSAEIKNLTLNARTGFGPSFLDADSDADEIFVPLMGVSILGGTGPDDHIVIPGMRMGADVTSGGWWVYYATAHLRDPKADYSLARAFTLLTSGLGVVDYTWNPKFISRDTTGLTGDPVSGLTVNVWDINEATSGETAVSGSPWTSDANGRINAPDGIILAARKHIVTTATEFSQRVLVQGPGYRAINMVIKMRSALDADVPVDFLLTDFEGEVST